MEIVRYLVEQANVPANIQNSLALIDAASRGRLEVVRYFVEHAPEALRIPADGRALIEAARNGRLEIVRYILLTGIHEFNEAECQEAITAAGGNEEIRRLLVEYDTARVYLK